MTKRLIWTGGVAAVVVLLLAYIIFTSVPYSISRYYHESIYNRAGQVIATVPVEVNGRVYRGLFATNQFVGTVKISGQTYRISTLRHRRSFAGTKSSFPYLGLVMVSHPNGVTTAATLWISSDFNSIVASSDAISKEYGKGAELTIPATSTVGAK